MRKEIINMLFVMFHNQDEYSVVSYDSVDDFYSYIGYELESENLLHELDVHGTSDLQELLMKYNQYLDNGSYSEEFENTKEEREFKMEKEIKDYLKGILGEEITSEELIKLSKEINEVSDLEDDINVYSDTNTAIYHWICDGDEIKSAIMERMEWSDIMSEYGDDNIFRLESGKVVCWWR